MKESPFKDPCSPGPGEYSGAVPRFGANANSFSMRPRTALCNLFAYYFRALETWERFPWSLWLQVNGWTISVRQISYLEVSELWELCYLQLERRQILKIKYFFNRVVKNPSPGPG